MPEVIRGSRSHDNAPSPATSPGTEKPRPILPENSLTQLNTEDSNAPIDASRLPSPPHLRHVAFRADSNEAPTSPRAQPRDRRRSSSFFRNDLEDRPEADAYYDSRAATKREWRRRATTLQDYYRDNPKLLPQLPFTWHHGLKRWRLIGLITLMWIDACVLPIALYYGMYYGGGVAGWIIFAIVTTIWGGPTYLEFALRTFKLMKKERFYRPLGTNSRWCFDFLTYVSVISITAVTTLFIVGSAPHIVWLRVLTMPMPALLYCLGGSLGFVTLYNVCGWKAPFRISSTGKGEPVKPGVYYFIEDTVAVNANAGRPFREALAARYDASPRFRQMLYWQSVFWAVPPLILAIPLTVIALIHSVPATVAYGICWAVPFIWATIWGIVSMWWVKRDMVRERLEWEATNAPLNIKAVNLETESSRPPSEQTQPTAAKVTPEQAV
ncbi:hypothetical protein H2198_003270 [Neophaeococcomyces mojaviensis]|uniref:Uncharacterized protein n=1 Tax=Neophaeococcomyces mojaviensis TaxID=3383035 RepID=A0ACC3ABP1_9EURO|nr:hypothetical protein H2198_003270 [Knufia sp. JES_112]